MTENVGSPEQVPTNCAEPCGVCGASDGHDWGCVSAPRVYVNGATFQVLAETKDVEGKPLLMIGRPNGRKQYVARRIESTTYGANRAYIIASAPAAEVQP